MRKNRNKMEKKEHNVQFQALVWEYYVFDLRVIILIGAQFISLLGFSMNISIEQKMQMAIITEIQTAKRSARKKNFVIYTILMPELGAPDEFFRINIFFSISTE